MKKTTLLYNLEILGITLLAAALFIGAQWANLSPATPLDSLISVAIVPYLLLTVLLATLSLWLGLFLKKSWLNRLGQWGLVACVGLAGGAWLTGIYESYQILPGAQGHFGLSNLYEVSLFLFGVMGWFSLSFTQFYKQQKILPVLAIILCADALFLTWLGGLGVAGPRLLVPALQSYWLPWHVMANFLAYGCFLIAGGIGVWALLSQSTQDIYARMMDRAIAIGFPLFTLAVILGALWANEAWGGYWSWDPKETWALMVWLVYAGYLHARHKPSFNVKKRAIWAAAGFVITLICYLGVNLFMDGLHSYGKLPS